jgi:hypothetical protein
MDELKNTSKQRRAVATRYITADRREMTPFSLLLLDQPA